MASSSKTIIITGANSGIGLNATQILTSQGHHIILACRSEAKAAEAIREVKAKNPQALCEFMQLDVSSQSSIHEFVNAFHEKGRPLHVLVNNAGFMYEMKDTERHLNDEGGEITMATNYLGPFLLTHLLLEDLKATASKDGEARIVSTTSSLHDAKAASMNNRFAVQPLDLDDLMMGKEGAYNGLQAYKNSKAAQIMFTRTLSRLLEGTGVICNCFCPGFIPATGLARHSSAFTRFIIKYVLDGLMKPFKKITRSVDEGGQSLAYLANNPDVSGSSGGYYAYDKLTDPSDEVKDESLQDKLWQESQRLLKIG